MQTEARKWANEFNKQGVPKPVRLLRTEAANHKISALYVLSYFLVNEQLIQRPHPGLCLCPRGQVDFLISTVVVLVNRDTRPTGTMGRYLPPPSYPPFYRHESPILHTAPAEDGGPHCGSDAPAGRGRFMLHRSHGGGWVCFGDEGSLPRRTVPGAWALQGR
jgi:hypothetical protein